MAKAAKQPKKKKAVAKKNVKKATPKKRLAKAVTKKTAKKLAPKKSFKRTASRPPITSVESGAETTPQETVVIEPACKCKKKNGLFFLMIRQKNGRYKESPMHAAFETLEQCEANCIG